MAAGMDMLMKSMGFNPDALKVQVEGFRSLFLDIAKELKNIRSCQEAILVNQQAICEKIGVTYVQPNAEIAGQSTAATADAIAAGAIRTGSEKVS